MGNVNEEEEEGLDTLVYRNSQLMMLKGINHMAPLLESPLKERTLCHSCQPRNLIPFVTFHSLTKPHCQPLTLIRVLHSLHVGTLQGTAR